MSGPLTDDDIREVVRRMVPVWALPGLRTGWEAARASFLPDGFGIHTATFVCYVTAKGLDVGRCGPPGASRSGIIPWRDVQRLLDQVPDALVDRIKDTLAERRLVMAEHQADVAGTPRATERDGSAWSDWYDGFTVRQRARDLRCRPLNDLLDEMWRDALLADTAGALF